MTAKRVAVIVGSGLFFVLAACGGGGEGKGREFEVSEEQQERQAAWAAMRATEEFQAALERYEQCMIGLGYSGVESADELRLPDGSPFMENGGVVMTGPKLRAFSDFGRCEDQSGVTAVRRAHGLAEPEPGPEEQKANEIIVAAGQCLQGKGWTVEPLRVGTRLQLDPDGPPGGGDAYRLDKERCLAQAEGREQPESVATTPPGMTSRIVTNIFPECMERHGWDTGDRSRNGFGSDQVQVFFPPELEEEMTTDSLYCRNERSAYYQSLRP